MNGSKKCSSNLEDKTKEGKEVRCPLQSRARKRDYKGHHLGLNACDKGCLQITSFKLIKNSICQAKCTTTKKVLTASIVALSVSISS